MGLVNSGHLKSLANAARNYASNLFSELANAVADSVEELESVKVSRSDSVSGSISTSGWVSDSTVSEYPYYYDIAATGVTENDLAIVVISPDSLVTARESLLCPTNQTLTDTIRLRARYVPASAINYTYRMIDGPVA